MGRWHDYAWCWADPHHWVIIGALDLDLGLVYMYGKLRHRPKTFMGNPRLNSAIFKFKS